MGENLALVEKILNDTEIEVYTLDTKETIVLKLKDYEVEELKDSIENEETKENKIDDLYTRMGNVTLKQIKDYVYENKNKKFINANKEPIVTSRALNEIKKALRKDFDSIKNMNEYEKLQNEIENSRQMDI
ncbi:hypothetical protein AM596_14765 [Clostridium perfringens CP4]|uniref:hypothetical protein n=1 Tax=Clostridium perfringens TaxID=1502 RepID=UPI000707A2F0|nr:hypothetical protein [Clostridium perfringens]KQC91417.1 hypothetical protein AM596_14765 [Clostridium perfringens CP4]